MPSPERVRLSRRAEQLVEQAPLPHYIEAHFERSATAGTEGNRYVGLAIAENKLMWDLLEPRLSAPRRVPPEAVGYDDMVGSYEFRRRVGRLLERTIVGRPVPAEHVAALAGAGSALEILFAVLADPGDGVLVPTPSYAGFWADLETRDELTIVPVHTAAVDGFQLTIDALEAALTAADLPIRALLFTNPSNPLGTVAAPGEVAAIIAWAAGHGIHVVLDEVYALSTFGGDGFVSGASLSRSLPDHVHLVWAFSKDFAMSGLRCGVLVTENERVMQAVGALAYWAVVSGDTQFILGEMIADDAWVDHFLEVARSRLGAAYRSAGAALDAAGISYVPAVAGFFVLADFRPFLAEPTWEAEERLWRRLLDEAEVNVTPGAACHVAEPGFMRLCFATEPPAVVAEAVGRIGAVLAER